MSTNNKIHSHNRIIFVLSVAALMACCQHAPQGTALQDSTAMRVDSITPDIPATYDTVSDAARRPDMYVRVRQGQALTIQTDGLTLTAVGGAVQHGAVYSVTSLTDGELPPLPQGMVNMTSSASGYRLLPGGEHFLPYAELRVAYDPGRLPKGYTPDDIYTSFYDTASMAWVRLERIAVDTVSHEIVSLTTHFTDFINELLKAPEMPETRAFVPTALSDLEAVNPMEGLPLITPPTANNEGTANLSYPIWTPAGRGGMQPSLALTYSSAGGNGWLGIGWDIGVPSITVDTRWGVPRYNARKETETYLLNGEQLVTHDMNGNQNPLPHRTSLQQDRQTGLTQFFARTGDAHDSIIRHGNLPSDYWWEVVDRNGTTHYYGHYPAEGMNTGNISTLTDESGNIARWMLCESRDLYGNWVRYFYDTVMTERPNPGRQIYLDSIMYTGNGNENGAFRVVFNRKTRSIDDRPVNCMYGFKEETNQALCNIAVKHEGTVITAYLFETEIGDSTNYKTRLKAVTKIDRISPNSNLEEDLVKMCIGIDQVLANYLTTRQEFDYYNAPAPDTLFGAAVQSTIPRDKVKGFLMIPRFRRTDSVTTATALGLTQSSGWSFGGAACIGWGPNVWTSDLSIGGNFHRGVNSSESLSSLVDLDGDGLADKVFLYKGKMYWRRQLTPVDNLISFGDTQAVAGVSHFLVESNTSTTLGVQGSVLAASGSLSWDSTVSTTSIYFADVDGDGLADIVDNGQVYFNRTVNGRPTFKQYQAPEGNVPEPMLTTSTDCGGIIFDGTVNDSVACRIVRVFDTVTDDMGSELIRLRIKESVDLGYTVLHIDSTCGGGVFHLYRYREVLDCSRRNLAMDGVPNTEAVRVWVVPETGTAHLWSSVRLVEDQGSGRMGSRHADGVTYTIQHSRTVTPMGDTLHSTKDTILMSRHICEDCYRTGSFDTQHYDSSFVFDVSQGDLLFFRLRSNDDSQFDNVEDLIRIDLNNHTYTNDGGFVLTDNRIFKAPYTGHYKVDGTYRNDALGSITAVVKGATVHTLTPVISASGDILKDSAIAVVISSTDPTLRWDKVECRARIRYWCDSLPDTVTVWTPGVKVILHPAGSVWGNTTYQCLFGQLYSGWGQFAYHPNGDDGGIIRPGSLVPSRRNVAAASNDTTGLGTSINTAVDFTASSHQSAAAFAADFGELYSPVNGSSRWVEMTADAEHGRWVSFTAQNSIGSIAMSNSVQEGWYSSVQAVAADSSAALPPPVVYDDAVPAPDGDNPAKGIRKVNRSNTTTLSRGLYFYGDSFNTGGSSIEMDYIDLNGDRYPDIVGTDYVQYRSQWGGMGTLSRLQLGETDVSASAYHSIGVSFGASGHTQERTPSSNPRNAKFTLRGDGSISVSPSYGWDHATGAWTDVNGDGLPDHIATDGVVRLNTGYGFLSEEDWHLPTIRSGQSVSKSFNIGGSGTHSAYNKYNTAQGSIQLAAGLSRSFNRQDHVLMDINGDGLPDMVWRRTVSVATLNWDSIQYPQDSVYVSFNKGGGRWTANYRMNIHDFNWSETYNESLDAGVTVGVFFLGVKVTGGINASPCSGGVGRDRMQLVDVNGDGLPDLVTSNMDNNLTVRYNKGGRTNLLRKVTNSTGSKIYMDYTLSEPSRLQPSRSWLLTSVTTKDPLNPDGGDTSATLFSYADPHYDRYERTFYGYGTVVTQQLNPAGNTVYRTVRRDFHNTNILVRGRLKRELTTDGSGNRYVEKVYQYSYLSRTGGVVDTCSGDAYSVCDRVVTRFYEGAASPRFTTAESFRYDRYHNVTRYDDEGDTACSSDGLHVIFSYLTGLPNNLVGLRSGFTVHATGETDWMRQTTYTYNNRGKLTMQTMHNTTGYSVYSFEYDNIYGNLVKATLPDNDSLRRLEYEYFYDSHLNTYPVKIRDSYRDSVLTDYDPCFGKPLRVTDPGGSVMEYSYDPAGRLIAVNSPLNSGTLPTVSHEYHPVNHGAGGTPTRPYAVTWHRDDNGGRVTETVVITDGFGRVIQTKRGITSGGVPKMQVSGRAVTDAFGRVVLQYDPVVEPLGTGIGDFNSSFATATPTATTYDILDRTVSVTQPLGHVTSFSYGVQEDAGEQRRFTTTVTDPLNNVTVLYSDHDGRRVQTTDAMGGVTTLVYDALGQLTEATDPEDFTTHYSYDRLGRLISRNHPDAGLTQYTYDAAGNLTSETNPLGQIFYDYRYQRPVKKRYSINMWNNVTYEYGVSGTGRGRPVVISDGTGKRDLTYDALGNVVMENRVVVVPGSTDEYRFTTRYKYDSWGRMLSMTYPDGERVNYEYLYGGDLFSMIGEKDNDTYSYVEQIVYNDFGQRSQILYGNGTTATYQYDVQHRLSNLTSVSASGTMQQIHYTLDGMGNIGSVQNTAAAIVGLGGTYTNEHTYDNLYRLASSTGGCTVAPYSQDMKYSPSGRLWQKTNYGPTAGDFIYGYCDDVQPHAPKRILEQNTLELHDLVWDAAGNLGQVNTARNLVFFGSRFLFWTEDSRLHTVVDGSYYSYYAYDHAGERTLKLTGDNSVLDVNAETMMSSSVLTNLTMYPSPYMVLSKSGYTKHYYIGSDRLCARIGGGGLEEPEPNSTLSNIASELFNECHNITNLRELNGNNLNCIRGHDCDEELLLQPMSDSPQSLDAVVTVWIRDFKEMVEYYSSNTDPEDDVFFYHSDHLGGANWITDASGYPVQHLQYMPFGETLVDQQAAGYQERFTFTGKEKDSESGYYYFGARYLDQDMTTLFLSVDTYADKYPFVSPYAYCAWNPIKLIDPTGDTLDVTNKKGIFLFSLDDNSKEHNTITAKELYKRGIQWFESNADNYMPLLSINPNIESIEGIDHFSWSDIERFAFTDRLMIEYRPGGSGDFKSRVANYFLCTVDGIPYWTDVIGQIPFAINCYKTQLMNGKSHSEAARITQTIGHLFANGFLWYDKSPNDADNWMIKRVCDWASKGLVVDDVGRCGRYRYYNIRRNSYNFNRLAIWYKISH